MRNKHRLITDLGVYSVPDFGVRYSDPQHKCINTCIKMIVVRHCGPQHKCINTGLHLIVVRYLVRSSSV